MSRSLVCRRDIPREALCQKALSPQVAVSRDESQALAGALLLGTTVCRSVPPIAAEIYEIWTFPSGFYYLSLQFCRDGGGLLFAAVGLTAVIVSVIQLNRSLLSVFLTPGRDNVVDIVYRHRLRKAAVRRWSCWAGNRAGYPAAGSQALHQQHLGYRDCGRRWRKFGPHS